MAPGSRVLTNTPDNGSKDQSVVVIAISPSASAALQDDAELCGRAGECGQPQPLQPARYLAGQRQDTGEPAPPVWQPRDNIDSGHVDVQDQLRVPRVTAHQPQPGADRAGTAACSAAAPVT